VLGVQAVLACWAVLVLGAVLLRAVLARSAIPVLGALLAFRAVLARWAVRARASYAVGGRRNMAQKPTRAMRVDRVPSISCAWREWRRATRRWRR
jgi:hypothetical protein